MDNYSAITPFGQTVFVLLWIFLIIVAVLWFFLPFAVFGIKRRIDAQTQLSRDILAELKALRTDQRIAARDVPVRNAPPSA